MKLTKKLLCLGFLLVLVLVPLLTAYGVLTNPTGWSAQENRALAGKPEVSAAALWTGDTAAQTEDFLKDHLYKRNAILKFGVWFQMRVLHRPVVEDVVLGSEVLLPVAEIADYRVGKLKKRADAMAESLAAIQAATKDAGGQFCYVLVPEQRSALRDYYPDWMENRAAQYDATRAAFTAAMEAHSVPLLDLTETYRAVDDLTEFAIARAISTRPPIIMADEPTGALDSKTGLEVLKFLQQLNKEGSTVILITHDNGIAATARRCVRLADGKIIEDHEQEVDWL